MPEAFERAVRAGARVRTKKLAGGKYIHIAFKGGKSYAGEVHTKKKNSPPLAYAKRR
jgi:hypothetical protein